MTEYTYPECTTSAISALSVFKKFYPEYRAADIEYAIQTPFALLFPHL